MFQRLLLTLLVFSSTLFALDCPDCGTNVREPLCGATYVKLGGGTTSTGRDTRATIVGALGKRVAVGWGSVDISAAVGDHLVFFPKLQGLFYFGGPYKPGLYAGGGLSYGWVAGHNSSFQGLFGEFTAGYDLMRDRRVLTFLEFTVSQPAVATKLFRGHTSTSYYPTITLCFGAGF